MDIVTVPTAERRASGRNRQGVQGAHLNPLGLFLEPPGPLLTRLHTVYMAYSECLPTRLSPLAERNCFSQVWMARCFPNGTMTLTGWTQPKLRAFLAFAGAKGYVCARHLQR